MKARMELRVTPKLLQRLECANHAACEDCYRTNQGGVPCADNCRVSIKHILLKEDMFPKRRTFEDHVLL